MNQSVTFPQNTLLQQVEVSYPGVGYEGAVMLIRQAIYEFRRSYADPQDDTLPIVRSYEQYSGAVDLISQRDGEIVIQLTLLPSGHRTLFECNSRSEYYVTANDFEDDQLSHPSHSYGILPSEANTDLLLQIYRYITNYKG